jgi:sulfopyruvate decarboxylase TPP-binding subunit
MEAKCLIPFIKERKMRVIEIPGHTADTSQRISVDALRLTLEKADIEYLVTLPESPYEVLLSELLKGSSIKIIQVCRESEGMSICSGLTYGGKTAALLCSYKGLYNSLDSLLGVALKTRASFLLLISEAEQTAEKIARSVEHGRHSVALLNIAQIPYYEIKSDGDMHMIDEALARTKESINPVAVLLRW